MIECKEDDCIFVFEETCHRATIYRLNGVCRSRTTLADVPKLTVKRDVITKEIPPPYRKQRHVREFEHRPGELRYMVDGYEVSLEHYKRVLEFIDSAHENLREGNIRGMDEK